MVCMPGQSSPGCQVLCVRAPSCGQHLPCVPLQLLNLQAGRPHLPTCALCPGGVRLNCKYIVGSKAKPSTRGAADNPSVNRQSWYYVQG